LARIESTRLVVGAGQLVTVTTSAAAGAANPTAPDADPFEIERIRIETSRSCAITAADSA